VAFLTDGSLQFNLGRYGFSFENTTDFVFEVKMCSNVTILFLTTYTFSVDITYSTISMRLNGRNTTILEDTLGTDLDCSLYAIYKFSWGNGIMSISRSNITGPPCMKKIYEAPELGISTMHNVGVHIAQEPSICKVHLKGTCIYIYRYL